VEIPLTLEPMESVLVVFNKTRRSLPARLASEALASATVIPVNGGIVPPPKPPREIIQPSPTGELTLSPVVAKPFEGTCQVPAGLDLSKVRVVLTMHGLSLEEAARITINGHNAGGFIGKPFRLEVAGHLKQGENTIRIEPFAPDSVRLLVIKGE